MVFFPIPGKFYGFSLLNRVWDVSNMMDNAMSRIQRRWEFTPEKIGAPLDNLGKDKDAVIAALRSSELWEIVDTGSMPAKGAVELIHGQIIYADEMNYLRYLIEVFQWISGMTYMQLGSGSARTATEAGIVGQSSDLRTARRMSVMERWVSTIGKRLLSILRYARENLPCREILGEEDYAKWEAYEARQSERERTKQDTDITVRMSLPVHTAALHRRDKMVELLGRMGNPAMVQLMAMQGKAPNVAALVQDILTDSGLNENYITDLDPNMAAMMFGKGQQGEA
jgi:hypothetical protein